MPYLKVRRQAESKFEIGMCSIGIQFEWKSWRSMLCIGNIREVDMNVSFYGRDNTSEKLKGMSNLTTKVYSALSEIASSVESNERIAIK